MPKVLEEPTTKIHLRLFSRDLDRVDNFRGTRMDRTEAIRLILRQFLNRIEAKAERNAQTVELEKDIEL